MNDTFSPEFWASIPEDLRAIPADVLALTSIPIKAREIDQAFKDASPIMGNADAIFDIDCDRQSLTIWFNRERATPRAVGHELIHMRRYLLESVPKLMPLESTDPEITEHIHMWENDAEHLFVIPEEIARFPDGEQWWTAQYQGVVDRATESTPLFFNYALIRNILPDQLDVARSCQEKLRSLGGDDLVSGAGNYRELLRTALPDKRAVLEVMLQSFRPVVRSRLCIARHVMRQGRLDLEEVA